MKDKKGPEFPKTTIFDLIKSLMIECEENRMMMYYLYENNKGLKFPSKKEHDEIVKTAREKINLAASKMVF